MLFMNISCRKFSLIMVLCQLLNLRHIKLRHCYQICRSSLYKQAQFVNTFQRSVSTTSSLAQYKDDYADPNPDPKFYEANPPSEDDDLAQARIKAAPTSQTYSVFYDEKLTKFEKYMLKKGKSPISRRLMRGALEHIKYVQVKKYHEASDDDKASIEVNPLVVFHQALENAKPLLGVTSKKKGSRSYKIPTVIGPNKQQFLVSKAIRNHVWSGHPNNSASIRLANEILAAYKNKGAAVKVKQEMHKTAFANRAYANL